ncbi:hypothetical protein HDN1F_03190 [gamma proteobacterium HdN1]|nr:hypothetical protein HDN1F_03190 [gamma proteobacterium HdN1]
MASKNPTLVGFLCIWAADPVNETLYNGQDERCKVGGRIGCKRKPWVVASNLSSGW